MISRLHNLSTTSPNQISLITIVLAIELSATQTMMTNNNYVIRSIDVEQIFPDLLQTST